MLYDGSVNSHSSDTLERGKPSEGMMRRRADETVFILIVAGV